MTAAVAARPSAPRHRAALGRALAAGLVTILGLSACGGGSAAPAGTAEAVPAPDETTPSTAATQAPSTELLDELLATRDESGRMPLDGALAAFAAVYGALPDVPTPSAPAGAIEGTTAARWLAAHDAELTPAQRAAVDAAMSPLDIGGTPLEPSDATAPSVAGLRGAPAPATPGVPTGRIFGPRGCFGGSFTFEDAPGAGKYRDLVRLALAELRLLLGPLDIPVYTAFSDFAGINADLNPYAPDCGQPAVACQIRLAPLALTMSDSTLVKTLAHELTHCYQARAVGATAIASLPDWLVEGFPSYVAETVGVSIGATAPNYWWDKWFKRPGIRLYTRTYDALGFYAVVRQAGGDPFGRYLTALRTQDSSAAFGELITGVAEHLGTIWGTTHFRQAERGVFWELDAPSATGYQPAIPTSTITSGGGYAASLAEAQAEASVFSLQAEVVVIELTGPAKGRYSVAGAADEVLPARIEWCTLGYPCVCPEDTQRAGTVIEQAPGTEVAIGAAAIANGGVLRLTGMSFADRCGPKRPPRTTEPPVPPAVDTCLIGSWVSDTWTIPGPPGVGLDLTGGAGITMSIDREGGVTTDFTGMATMQGAIPQPQSGSATQVITAAGGTTDELSTNQQMPIGPGVFALWQDTTRYECGPASFTMIAFDRVESVDIRIPFHRAG